MFDSTRLFLFLTAAALLAIAPGPGMLYVLARSLAGGKREGVLSAFGTFLGGMVHVFAAALGMSIVLAKSAVAFATVKYVGAAYLCFLGVRMILDARREEAKIDTVSEAVARDVKPARNPLWQIKPPLHATWLGTRNLSYLSLARRQPVGRKPRLPRAIPGLRFASPRGFR